MNLTFNDPRRIGKSAVLQLLESASSKDVAVVKTSVQDVHSLNQFVMHLLEVLHKHESLGRRARKRIGEFVETTQIGVEVDGFVYSVALKRGHKRMSALTLLKEVVTAIDEASDGNELLVLAVDEFTEAVINIASQPDGGRTEATQLLQTLQRLRKEQGRVRWILTGSIGIHHAIRRTDCTSAVISGDCKNIAVGPLSPEYAEHLSRCLALGEEIELSAPAHAHLAASVDGIPILIHAVIDDLRKQQPAPARPFDVEDIDAAIERYINDNDESRTFEHFVSRLSSYYVGDELQVARTILDRAASRDQPFETDSVISHVADQLSVDHEVVRGVKNMVTDDHYLVDDDGRLKWRYPILKRIWRRKR